MQYMVETGSLRHDLAELPALSSPPAGALVMARVEALWLGGVHELVLNRSEEISSFRELLELGMRPRKRLEQCIQPGAGPKGSQKAETSRNCCENMCKHVKTARLPSSLAQKVDLRVVKKSFL